MKTYILSATVGTGGVSAGEFVKKDGSGGVITNDAAGTGKGLANATKAAADKVGVIVEGICQLPKTVNATYNFGDDVELDADGQTVKAGTTNKVGIAIETKTTTADDNSLWVLIDMI